MKKAIQFGAGNIGRGFIGMLLAQSGYEVIFADVNEQIIDQLAADQCYTVHVRDVTTEDHKIENVDAILSTGEEIIDAISEAEILTTAVGLTILPRIAPTIAAGIIKRAKDGVDADLNIVSCENAIRASSQLKDHVYQNLDDAGRAYADAHVGFPDCAVDRIVPPGKNEVPTDVIVESYFEWDVEKGGFKGEIPEITGMTLVDNLDAYIERKLFTLNTGHAITAYIGTLRGMGTIDEAISDKDIYDIVHEAMVQSGEGLIKKHGLDPKAHTAYIEKIINRFKNPHLHDDVRRVGREPLRKLSADDRLVKPMMTARNFGLPVDKLMLGIGAALHYDNSDDPQSVDLMKKVEEFGVRKAFSEVSGVEDETVLDEVQKAYDAF